MKEENQTDANCQFPICWDERGNATSTAAGGGKWVVGWSGFQRNLKTDTVTGEKYINPGTRIRAAWSAIWSAGDENESECLNWDKCWKEDWRDRPCIHTGCGNQVCSGTAPSS